MIYVQPCDRTFRSCQDNDCLDIWEWTPAELRGSLFKTGDWSSGERARGSSYDVPPESPNENGEPTHSTDFYRMTLKAGREVGIVDDEGHEIPATLEDD